MLLKCWLWLQVLEKNDRFASLISRAFKNCTPSQVLEKVQAIYVLPLLQVMVQNRCECWFESIQTSFYPTIWAFYWVSFSIQFVNSLKSLQPAWRASAFSEQILFWRIPFFKSRYLCILDILIIIFKYSITQIFIECDTLRNSNVVKIVLSWGFSSTVTSPMQVLTQNNQDKCEKEK